MTAIDELWICR